MRYLLLVALTLSSAYAQTPLELVNPLLLVDGQRIRVSGAPLIVSEFSALEMELPRWGTVRVSDVPFDGARRAGDFDGPRLVLVVEGRSVRLRSDRPLLASGSPIPAYARLDTSALTPTDGPAYVRLVGQPMSRPPVVVPPPVTPDPPPPTPAAPLPPVSGPTDELTRQLEALRAERDQLRMALARTEAERDDARLRLAVLREEVNRLQQEVSEGRPSEARLIQERDALRTEVARLRASLAALGTPAAQPAPRPESPLAETPSRISLPNFDLARLRNSAQVRARLQTTPYPEWADYNGIGGDVLVLLQTDVSGAVIRTAVPRPIGGGLDALAEEIVQAMRFIPVRADGQATGLRSQVVVRFEP